ncbi:hypothetical protein BO71DRAFT_166312 [Aspergillus ellipticus CBS 707.79]|uniref:Uncharacterized protein n=1 Tax=Aspergillus ellipticus CBS 707.79 TaxID=1448320 RepID=A0A319CQY7_9EURO|nr:hypothetical protein BO71DRAFT_166312 [Aspergillus ellipticus CBS 707.79]
MAMTIGESFNQKFPREPNIMFCFKESYREFKSYVQSTVETEPMSVFIKEDISVYMKIAERYFPQMKPFSPLRERMPVLEKTHRLETESDVSRLAILQY